jgi:LysR family nitrogen assimilation transcriptional regulator
LLAGRLDLAVLYNPDPCPELEFVPLFSESLCLIGPAVPTQLGKVVPPGQTVAFEDLVGLPMILPGPTHVIRRLLDRHATLQGVPLTVALEISSIQAIIDLVCGGHGFAVLPRSTILHSGRQGDMQVNSLSASAPEVVLSLAQALNKRTTPLSKAASTIVKDLLLQTLQA